MARRCLDEAVRHRLSYGWWAFTVTRNTHPQHYGDQVGMMKKIDFKALLATLSSPGVGVIASVHLQDNVHQHALYWGPLLEEADLRHRWQTITGSDKVCVKPADNIRGWITYQNRLPEDVSPERLTTHWLDTRGMLLVSYYGTLNPRALNKLDPATRSPGERPSGAGAAGHSDAA
jgi:hypothetical protein